MNGHGVTNAHPSPRRVEGDKKLQSAPKDALERIAIALELIAQRLESVPRMADVIAPAPGTIVGTPYVASALGCTTVWVAEMVRHGQVPRGCVVPGTGSGRPWRFYRQRIDEWLRSR